MFKKSLVLVALALSLTTSTNTEPISPADIVVIDGDGIRVHNQSIRLVGFNAPETWKPACPAEQLLGDRAKNRLRELVHGGQLELTYVVCSCPAGTQGTPMCNYGRACGTLRSHDRDVGAILIAEGLAVPFVCGATHCPPTPRPWCR
jgi:endonuclease YncB( thermonuclease family)